MTYINCALLGSCFVSFVFYSTNKNYLCDSNFEIHFFEEATWHMFLREQFCMCF